MKSTIQITPGKIISQRFVISKQIGAGSFGCVYQGYDIQKGLEIAIKLEDFDKNDEKAKKESLMKEAMFLYELKGEKGIPQMSYFVKTETKRILVMTLLGLNLETFFQKENRKFPLKTVLDMAGQMLTRLEQVHSKEIIHRDLKPENFLLGVDSSDTLIYLVDFGLSKKYKVKEGHIPFKSNVGLVGTARYASLNAHLGNEQSRKDDLESLGYILIYFLKGFLPWMGLSARSKEEKHKKIIDSKKNTSFQKLCKDLPLELEEYFNYVRKLGFDEDPDYSFLRNLFYRVLLRIDSEETITIRGMRGCEMLNSEENQKKIEGHLKFYGPSTKTNSYHRPSCFNPRISKYSDLTKTMMRLDEAEREDEDPKCEELAVSKAFSSKTNNHQNQTNFLGDQEYDNLNLLEEFNVGLDEEVTIFTKMDFLKLNPAEKKCLGDLNSKFFQHSVTFSKFLIDEENFQNTNEYSSRTGKLIDRLNFLSSNFIKYTVK